MAGPIKASPYSFFVALTSQADTDIFKTNPTLAAGDVTVSKDGGTANNITTLPYAFPAAGAAVIVPLSATEMDADVVIVKFTDAAGSEWQDLMVTIITETASLTSLNTAIAAIASAATIADAVWDEVISTGHAVANSAGLILYTNLNATISGIADAVWDEVISVGHAVANSAGKILYDNLNGTISGVAAAAATAVWGSVTRQLTSPQAFDLTGNITGSITSVSNVVSANVTQISGDGTAADNAESFFDGTGYAGTNNVIPTVTTTTTATTVTNMVTANVTQISGDAIAADNAESFFDGTGYAGTNNVIPTVTTTTTATNVTTVNGIANGAITAAAIADNAIDAATFAADVDAEFAAYVWNALTASYGIANSYGALIELLTIAGIADGVWDEAIAGHLAAGSTGAALNGATAPTAANVADAVWDEGIAGHLVAGSTGFALNAAGAAGDPWSTLLPGVYGAGTAGDIIGNIVHDVWDEPLAGHVAAGTTGEKLDLVCECVDADEDGEAIEAESDTDCEHDLWE